MDYTTDIPVEEVLGRTQAYFAQNWAFGGRYIRHGNEIVCSIQVPRGCVWGLLDQFMLAPAPEHRNTRLLAYPRGRRTVLTVTADEPEHGDALAAFLRDELHAKPS